MSYTPLIVGTVVLILLLIGFGVGWEKAAGWRRRRRWKRWTRHHRERRP